MNLKQQASKKTQDAVEILNVADQNQNCWEQKPFKKLHVVEDEF